MPIIPRADESQVLNAGSPVPLRTGDSGAEIYAKAAGQLSQQFGKLLMQQGNALRVAQNKAEDERRKADSENAQTDYSIALAEMENNFKKDPEYGQISTSEMMKRYREESQRLADSFSNGLTDDFTKANFDREASKITAQNAIKFHAEALKDYNSITSNKVDSYISKRASIVSSSLTKESLTTNIAAVTARIYNNDIYTTVEKDNKVTAARKELLSAYLNGHVSQIMQAGSPQQREAISQKALREIDTVDQSPEGAQLNIAGIFSEKEKEKFRDEITEAVYKANGRELQRINTKETMDNRHMKEAHQKNFKDLAIKGIVSVNDEATYEIFQEEVRAKAQMGLIDPLKVDDLEKLALESRGRKLGFGGGDISAEQMRTDDKYREEIYKQAFTVSNPTLLLEDTYTAMKKKGISANASVGVHTELENLAKVLQKDPGLKARVNSSIQEFDKLSNNPGMKQFSREQQLKAIDAIGKAKLSLYKAVMINPKVDVKATAEDLYQLEIKPVLDSFMPTMSEPVDKKAIMEEVRVINEEYYKLKKEGKLTPEINKDIADRLKKLKLKMGSTK